MTSMPSYPAPANSTRVTKKLAPNQHGAIKLARRFGACLVCVRYRVDAENLVRYTTVELVVDTAALQDTNVLPRTKRGATIAVSDSELAPQGSTKARAIAMALGARWNPRSKVWHIPSKYAELLMPQSPQPKTKRTTKK